MSEPGYVGFLFNGHGELRIKEPWKIGKELMSIENLPKTQFINTISDTFSDSHIGGLLTIYCRFIEQEISQN